MTTTTINLGLALAIIVIAVVLNVLTAATTKNALDFIYNLNIYYDYDVALKNKIVALAILDIITVIITVSLIGLI